jgi:hypothetical protein
MSSLVKGKIPANTVCPYHEKCPCPKDKTCGHTGEQHPVPYSCGLARLFDVFDPNKESTHERND